MIIFLPNCCASINFTRFIFKSFEHRVCSAAYFSKAGKRLGPPGPVAKLPSFFRLFIGGTALGISPEGPRGGGDGDGSPSWGLPGAEGKTAWFG